MRFNITGLVLLLLLGLQGLFGQSKQVTGQVLDDLGEPLIQATVLVKGTTLGTFTDDQGRFNLAVSGSDAVLQVRYVGFETQEEAVGSQTELTIIMISKAMAMDEVVVLGYAAQKRSKITGSVSTISAEEITETPVLRIDQALQGRAAGVQVTQNSGQPGTGMTVRIRGIGTINNADPLFVVDGVIVDNIDFVNPNDIANISVLKDAASTAIYGTNGANGVVLITTKNGTRNRKAEISYDGYYGVQEPWKKLNLLDAEEYAILINEARIAAELPLLPAMTDPQALGAGTDWQDAIFATAPITSHQLSARGGGDRADYALSGNYFSQQGIVGGPKAQFDRLTLRFNANYDLNDRVKAGTRINYVHLERDALPENNEFTTPLIRALNLDPLSPIQDADGNYLPSQYLDTDIFNPVNQIENTYSTYRGDRIFGSMFAVVELMEGLSLKSSINLNLTNGIIDGFAPEYFLSINDQNPLNGVSKQHQRTLSYQWDNTLTYEKVFAEQHEVTFLLGSSAITNKFEYTGANRTGLRLNDPRYAYLDNGDPNPESSGAFGGVVENSLLSFFTRGYYSYAGKYMATAILRIDGSSRFGPNNRFGYFPSISLGWVLSEEQFLANVNALNFLKLRGSYGRNGNQNIPDFQYLDLIANAQQGNGTNGSYSYVFGPGSQIVSGNAPPRRGNQDVKWETTEQYNVGIDAGFWNDRLYFTADAFLRFTQDMLLTPPELGHVGALNSVVNAGSMRNQGLEFSLNYQEYLTSQIKLTVGGNISFIQNELTSLGDGGTPLPSGFLQQANGFISRTEVGFPIAYLYGFETDGIFQNAEEVANHAFQADRTAPGDLRFKDQNNDGVINEDDKVLIGNPFPDLSYGVNLGVNAYGFDLSIFLQGVQGNEIYRGFTRYDFNFANQPVSRLERWTGPGTSETEPRAVWGDPNQNARISDYFVEDGSFLRIKNVQLAYNFSEPVLEKLRLKKLRLYATGTNLFAFTNYSGLDPEIGTRGTLEIGIDRGFYPAPRMWLAGIQIGLQ